MPHQDPDDKTGQYHPETIVCQDPSHNLPVSIHFDRFLFFLENPNLFRLVFIGVPSGMDSDSQEDDTYEDPGTFSGLLWLLSSFRTGSRWLRLWREHF